MEPKSERVAVMNAVGENFDEADGAFDMDAIPVTDVDDEPIAVMLGVTVTDSSAVTVSEPRELGLLSEDAELEGETVVTAVELNVATDAVGAELSEE